MSTIINWVGESHPQDMQLDMTEQEWSKIRAAVAEGWGEDDDVAKLFAISVPSSDGLYRVTVPGDAVGEFEDVVYDAAPGIAQAIEAQREAALASVQAALDA